MADNTRNNLDEKLKLIDALKLAIQQDNELRKQHLIGDRFRFVRDRLQAMLDTLEQSVPLSVRDKKKPGQNLPADETLIYVYLYNAQGLQFRSWQNLVAPKVFYEYSVNRPIYSEKKYIESLLRTKSNKAQHAYLTVAVKKDAILTLQDELKDIIGNPLVKVREGSLLFEKLVCFTHLDQEYILNEEGIIQKNTL